jgi:hypothetical protein
MGAILSPCGLYRYRLSRDWGRGEKLAFIMLNPSTADATQDDPTIRRCVRFAHDAGYSGIVVGNLFAYRATNPTELKCVGDPVGPDNDLALNEIVGSASTIVCAWGSAGSLYFRGDAVLRMICDAGQVPHCLRMSANGQPAHPLYLPAYLRPIPMSSCCQTSAPEMATIGRRPP